MVDNTVESILNEYTEKSSDINDENNTLVFCSTCQVNFYDSTEYEKHKRDNHAKKKYKCYHCDSSFHRQDHLKRHINSLHSSFSSLICAVCGTEFKNREILNNHMKVEHSNEDAFFCRECFLECESIETLQEHENTHTSLIRHACSYCDKLFKRRDHMLRHIKTIHLNYSVNCPECSQTFKRNDHLARHCREKHRFKEKSLIINNNAKKEVDLIKISVDTHIDFVPDVS